MNHSKHLVSFLFGLSVLYAASAQAGFFDQMMDSAKKAAKDTLEDVIQHSDNNSQDTPQSKQTRQEPRQPARSAESSPPSKPAYARELVRQIQERLNVLGVNAGTPDGLYGPGTQRAIKTFQSQQGLPIDGRPSDQLLAQLDSRVADMVIKQQTPATASGTSVGTAAASVSPASIKQQQMQAATPGQNVQSTRTTTASNAPLQERGFSQPECAALGQWAAGHSSKDTITLAPKVIISDMFADQRTVPVFGSRVASWTSDEFTKVRRGLNDCRRIASKQKNRAESDNLYQAYKVLGPTARVLDQMNRFQNRSIQAVDNLSGYHRSDDLVKVLGLADRALQGEDVTTAMRSIRVTRSVRGEVQSLQNAYGYLTQSDIEALRTRLKQGSGEVKQEMAAKNERFEALKLELDNVPMTMEGAHTLDRLRKDPVLQQVSRQELMDFENAVMKKRRAISVAVRQQKAQQTAAAAAVPVDIAPILQNLITGDSVDNMSLRGVKPGIPYRYATKFMSTRFDFKMPTGGVVFKEFGPTRNAVKQYNQRERSDGGHFEFETMNETVGQVKFIEHFTGALDVKAASEWFTQRLGKPDEFKFYGNAAAMKWRDGGMNLSIVPGNRTALPYRNTRDYKSSLVITMWSDEYQQYLVAAKNRCTELRNKPARDLSNQDKMDILNGCKS